MARRRARAPGGDAQAAHARGDGSGGRHTGRRGSYRPAVAQAQAHAGSLTAADLEDLHKFRFRWITKATKKQPIRMSILVEYESRRTFSQPDGRGRPVPGRPGRGDPALEPSR